MAVDALIFDDDTYFAALLQEVLKAQGLRVKYFSDGNGAIEHIRRERPGIVLTDVMMPGMDGITLCQKVKMDPEISATKVVIVTGKDFPEDKARAEWAAADLFVRKPLDVASFTAQLNKLIQKANGDRALVGDSLGGLFGLYALFSEPSSFGRYVLGSPSIWWTGRSILQDEAKFAASHPDLAARVFMSVGLDEEPGHEADAKASSDTARARLARAREARMVSNLRDLDATLRSRSYDGLALTTHLFEGETHLSVVPATISRGLRVVFG